MSSGDRYTREVLARAAECCDDIDEVIAYLGTRPYPRLGRYLLERFARHGIDVSHFRPVGRRARPADDAIRQAVAESCGIAETLRRLKLPDSGTQRAALRRFITENGVSTAHFLGQAHQRGRPAFTPLKPASEILVRNDGGRRTRAVVLRRALHEIGVPERCAECGTPPEWFGAPMTLEIDHINGDWSDNRQENLRLLCPNCHAITGSWCRGGRRGG
ncbi:HNH endonuclease signature motif containing protein [Streptomyces sp. NPDC047014]|uniref:HNH endonuclease n=1 Tax=Streptomyces sp. NPDC047014 TaxID=3155736 RepID=UPI0033F4841C